MAVPAGVWRHWITLAMRHRHQLLLPRPLASQGAFFSCLGTQNVSRFSGPNKEHMWSKSWKAGGRPRACLHLCPGGLSDQSAVACGHCLSFLLGLTCIASFAQWILMYKGNVTTIYKPQTQHRLSCFHRRVRAQLCGYEVAAAPIDYIKCWYYVGGESGK